MARIAGVNIPQNKLVHIGLTYIYGIGDKFSNQICKSLEIPAEKRKILEKRSDDDLKTILKRYDTYMDTTRPVLDYYSKNPNFYEIDGTLEIDQITSKINDILKV